MAGIAGLSKNHPADYDGYWAEREIVSFLASHCRL